MTRGEVSLLLGLLFAVLASSVTAFAQTCDALTQDVLRLHVLANSDSEADQQLKLDVRDAILRDTAELFAGSDSVQAAREAARAHLPQIEAAARRELQRQGSAATVSVSLEETYFETRVYEDFTLPAGRYEAVRVVIGSGEGHNWWCVLYPQLCIPAATPRADSPLTPAEQAVVDAPVAFEPRFALVEWWQGLQNRADGC